MRFLAFLLCFCAAVPAQAASPIKPGSILSLRECIEIALTSDPDIKVQVHNARAQNDVMRQTRAGYLPSLSLTGAYLSNHAVKQNLSDPAATSFVTYDGKSAGASLNQLVFDFGKTPASIAAAKALTLSARYNTESEAVAVVNMVKQAYHGLVLAKLALKLSEETVEQYRR
ncbi:MAG TPA: TolC family protein, partial [Elusimicrobiales bacterium]|nr:TolC family protein [Elusimicrobiales bacterium]